jgi:hypothetical protein
VLSEQAETLAELLRVLTGPGATGIGPDAGQLVDLWRDEDPGLLRPAIEELRGHGFIDVEYRQPLHIETMSERPPEGMPEIMPDREAGEADLYRIEDIAGVVVLKPLQAHFAARAPAARHSSR